jgi:hypothetical protein
MGFTPTFVRAIAYALAGADRATCGLAPVPAPDTRLERLYRTMRVIYGRLAIALVVILGIGGSMAAVRPIGMMGSQGDGWTAWAVMLVATAAAFANLPHAVFLQGADRLATVRRIEVATSSLSTLLVVLALVMGGGIVLVALGTCLGPLIASLAVRWQCRREWPGLFAARATIDPELLRELWPATWRSGVGVLMSSGAIQVAALTYAQLGSAAQVASFLLSLRVLQVLVTASQAPFYTKLPRLARLYAAGEASAQMALASRGMALSHGVYAAGIILTGAFVPRVLEMIGSNATFVAAPVWVLMGAAFFVERYGAMHLQLYSVTNDIIWHKANGVSGALFLATLWMAHPQLGLYAFPVAVLCGYLGFYSWYAAWHSYKVIGANFWAFESRTSAIPAAALLLAMAPVLVL